MIVDTSAIVAYVDAAEPAHAAVSRVIEGSDETLVVSPYVMAEVDCLVSNRHGVAAELEVIRELAGGAWELASMDAERVQAAARLVERFRDQPIGLADASNIVLAEAYRTRTIATLDRRHFGVLRFGDGTAVTIVP